jgi:hypothetical protein
MIRRRPGEPVKKWSALALFGMMAASAADVIFLPRLPFNEAQVIRHRSQKKKRLIARRRNQVQG